MKANGSTIMPIQIGWVSHCSQLMAVTPMKVIGMMTRDEIR